MRMYDETFFPNIEGAGATIIVNAFEHMSQVNIVRGGSLFLVYNYDWTLMR